MSKLIHIMIRVLEEERSLKFYKQAFGLEVCYELDFESFKLLYLRNADNDIELELTVNKGQTQAYDLGNGYGHIAFCVDDLKAEHQRFVEAGLEPKDIVDFSKDGQLVASFFFVSDPDGYKIEVLQKAGHYQ